MKQVVIAGGGSAGWMAAAFLSNVLGHSCQVTLVESEEIGIVGVGEATIPPILLFNNVLGISEREFIAATNGTFKLGIQFENWGQQGDAYMHAFGEVGPQIGLTSFHHYWLKAKAQGLAYDYWDFSPSYQAAKAEKFAPLHQLPGTPFSNLAYAYHFDATLYANLLRKKAEAQGVTRVEGKIAEVVRAVNGDIAHVVMADGRVVAGDLFIDCTGFRSLLLGETLQVGYEDWSHWLPCNRAMAVPSANVGAPVPYTRAMAHQAGWQWRIPLQHRSGNGLVYCSQFLTEAEASAQLLANLAGPALAEPRPIRFTTGKRKVLWSHNCIALGLASGFLEPLESTSLHLIQSGIIRLVKLFPGNDDYAALRAQYNRQSQLEFEQIRNFIILHYHQTQRSDSEFWRYCQQMSIPDELTQKIELFQQSGVVLREQDELFSEVAWQQVMLGQGLMPSHYHVAANKFSDAQLKQLMQDMKVIVQGIVHKLPTHAQTLAQLRS